MPKQRPSPQRLANPSTGLGRVCLITGAASERGMGRASAVLLGLNGGRIVVTDLPRFEAMGRKVVEEIVSDGGQAAWCPLDVTDENQWKAAIKFAEATFGHLDVLLNNAGIGGEYQHYMVPHDTSKDGIWKHPTADYRKILSVNQDSVYFGIREGAGSMLKNKVAEGKSIINISSDAAFGGNTGFAYTASKWAVRGMSKHAALTLAPFNIRCSSIHPGIISTDIMNDAMGSRSEKEVNRIQDRWNKFHPMGRTGKAEEIAHLVVYLASPESSFTSGAEISVDGALLTQVGYLPNPFPVAKPSM